MAALTDIFPDIKQLCRIDSKGVYLDGEKVALSNSRNSAYTRYLSSDGIERIEPHGGLCNVRRSLRMVASVPGGNKDNVRRAVVAALSGCDVLITNIEMDKKLIAEAELIPEEELTKFNNVVMIMVDYQQEFKQIFDPSCDYQLC